MVLLLISGVAISITVQLLQHARLVDERHQSVASTAESWTGHVTGNLRDSEKALRAMGAMFGIVNASLSHSEFSWFIRDTEGSDMVFQALEWVPRVPHASRSVVEHDGADDYPGFHFTERDEQGQLGPAGNRTEYYPVRYVVPVSGNNAAIGFDLGSSTVRRAAIEKSASGGVPVASSPLRLVQEQSFQVYAVLYFVPVYYHDGNGIELSSPQDRIAMLAGFVLGVIRVPDLVIDAPDTDFNDVACLIYDCTDDCTTVYATREHVAGINLEYMREIVIADRSWAVECYDVAEESVTGGIQIAVAGCAATALLVLTCHGNITRAAALHKMVLSRTQNLSMMNRLLHEQVAISNETAKALRDESAKTDTLLLNLMPASVCARIRANQYPIADRIDDASVLFIDIVGFTQYCSGCHPLDVVQQLDKMFSEFDVIATHYDVERIKTIGDSYMATCGVNTRPRNHAVQITRFAQAVLRWMSTSAAPDFQLRVGINAGSFVAGVVGTTRFAYDVWGDAVNIASRMEATGRPGHIHATEAIRQRISGSTAAREFRFESRQVTVKGKGTMTTCFIFGCHADQHDADASNCIRTAVPESDGDEGNNGGNGDGDGDVIHDAAGLDD